MVRQRPGIQNDGPQDAFDWVLRRRGIVIDKKQEQSEERWREVLELALDGNIESTQISYQERVFVQEWVRVLEMMERSVPKSADEPYASVGINTSLGFSASKALLCEIGYEPPTRSWSLFRYHAEQCGLYHHRNRFALALAGRRSGKTDLDIRICVRAALSYCASADGLFIIGAPTREQAYQIYWDRLKKYIPPKLLGVVSESRLFIKLVHGAMVQVMGMDKPMRAEGRAIDGAILDEFQDMDEMAWYQTVRPALSTAGREGWAILSGKPRAGREHVRRVLEEAVQSDEWSLSRWKSDSVIAKEEVDSARKGLDEFTFRQEYEAELVSYGGKVYYTSDRRVHARYTRHLYHPGKPLEICLDFNIAPGVALILQTMPFVVADDEPSPSLADTATSAEEAMLFAAWPRGMPVGEDVDVYLDEVFIPRDSNTEMVCNELVKRWGRDGTIRKHSGPVWLYGDATGGRGGTAQVRGSDWDIAKRILGGHFGWNNLTLKIPRGNPPVVTRVNALNARFRSVSGDVRSVVAPRCCPRFLRDLAEVGWDPFSVGTSAREIEKKAKGADAELTHLSDAASYRAARRFGWMFKSVVTPLH